MATKILNERNQVKLNYLQLVTKVLYQIDKLEIKNVVEKAWKVFFTSHILKKI